MLTQPSGGGPWRRSLVVSPTEGQNGYKIENWLENVSNKEIRGAVWAITAVLPNGIILSPCDKAASPIRRWQAENPGEPETWEQQADYIVTTPRGLRRKAGWFSNGGWVALLREDCSFLISTKTSPALASGCGIEVFTCADFCEMETLGPEVSFLPGQRVRHTQHWHLLPGGFRPHQWRELARSADELSVGAALAEHLSTY
jgi:hypothetical protein